MNSRNHGVLRLSTAVGLALKSHQIRRTSPKRDAGRLQPRSLLKDIAAIAPGDLVWAWDESAGMAVRRRVSRLYRHFNRPVLEVQVSDCAGNASAIIVTTEHPFWVRGRGWVAANALSVDDTLHCLHGGPELHVSGVISRGNRCDVFNFEVAGTHNYFVGARGVLVHNASDLQRSRVRLATDDPRIASEVPFKRSNLQFTKVYETDNRLVVGMYVSGAKASLPIGRINLDSAIGGFGLTLENRVELGGQWRKLAPQGFSITEAALAHGIDAYTAKFGGPPTELQSVLEKTNLRVFQQEFIAARAALPDAGFESWAQAAIRNTPFGRARVQLGYGEFSFAGDFVPGTVKSVEGVAHHEVPTRVSAVARPSRVGSLVDALADPLRPSELNGSGDAVSTAPYGLTRAAPTGVLDLAGRPEGALAATEMGSSVRFFPLVESPGVAAKVLRPETIRILGNRLAGKLAEVERGHQLFDALGLMPYYGAGLTTEGVPYLAVGMHDGFRSSGNFSVPQAHVEHMSAFESDFGKFLQRRTGVGYGDFQWGYDRHGQFRVIDPPPVATSSQLDALLRAAPADLRRWMDPATTKIRL